MNNYLMMGRVCDADDIAIIVNAPNLNAAKVTFTNYLKQKQSWSIGSPVYIEQDILLSEALENTITSESFADITHKNQDALSCELQNNSNIALVAAYDASTSFNPYDIAGLLCGLSDDTGEASFHVNEAGDDRTIVHDGEIVINTEDRLSIFYYVYHALQANIKKTIQYYFDSYELLVDIGEDPKNSKLCFSELKAFPKDN